MNYLREQHNISIDGSKDKKNLRILDIIMVTKAIDILKILKIE